MLRHTTTLTEKSNVSMMTARFIRSPLDVQESGQGTAPKRRLRYDAPVRVTHLLNEKGYGNATDAIHNKTTLTLQQSGTGSDQTSEPKHEDTDPGIRYPGLARDHSPQSMTASTSAFTARALKTHVDTLLAAVSAGWTHSVYA